MRYCLHSWWERIGMTQASGITKLVMSEAGTFPEVAAYYQQHVINPGHDLLKRILQRGVDRGEFRAMNLEYAVYSLIAPMIFLLTWKHSMAPCCPPSQQIEPKAFIDSQVDLLLRGMQVPALDRGLNPAPPSHRDHPMSAQPNPHTTPCLAQMAAAGPAGRWALPSAWRGRCKKRSPCSATHSGHRSRGPAAGAGVRGVSAPDVVQRAAPGTGPGGGRVRLAQGTADRRHQGPRGR